MFDDSGDDPLAQLEFPGPRTHSEDAIYAAQQYIIDNDGATKVEIIDGLAPEDNHPIGHNGFVAKHKVGDIDSFREWWWNRIVEPGLQALPDVELAESGTGEWLNRA